MGLAGKLTTVQPGMAMTVKEMDGRRFGAPQLHEDHMDTPTPKVIEIAAKEVGAELERQGISPDERVTLTIEPELIPGRRESRKLVIAAGMTDDDIDRLIKQAQQEVEPLLPR
jgi:hypothetical protein